MSLCVDLVLNHTAKEHAGRRRRQGDPVYQDYYLMFDTPDMPTLYEQTLVEVFPDNAPGNFTHYPRVRQMGLDHNRRTPVGPELGQPGGVPTEIVEVMLFLADKGVDVLRLDAVALCGSGWGTRCQSSRRSTYCFRRCARAAGSPRRRCCIWRRRSSRPPRCCPTLDAASMTGKKATSPITTA